MQYIFTSPVTMNCSRTSGLRDTSHPVRQDIPMASTSSPSTTLKHQTWGSKLDYVLTVVGFSTGWGTLLKFPYMVMRNGGGAFLLLFIIFSILGTIPCVFLEMTMGQFSQSGPVSAWNLCPAFKGIGVGTVLITSFVSTYFPCLIAWCLYYFYYSFSSTLPWATCDNEWNTLTCIAQIEGSNVTGIAHVNITPPSVQNTSTRTDNSPGMTAAEEFWRFKALEISSGLDDIGVLRSPLVACLVITYTIAFFFMFKGIRVSGKIVYVTVGIPYIVITVFLIRGCLLPGAADGIYYYIYPKFDKLLNPKVWVEAMNYALYSLGIALGCIITLAQHNKFSNNCIRDAVCVTLLDVLTTIYVGFAFFAVMGYVAHLRGVTVEAFESSGFNLGFIVYPQAISALPLPQLWAVLAFLLIFTLGIDTMVPQFEIIVMALAERFPKLGHRRWLVILVTFFPFFLIGLVYMSEGGIYVLTLVDWYAFFPSMALFATLECLVFGWIYGLDKLDMNCTSMWGKKIPLLMKICLKFVCPCLLLIIFCYSLYSYRPPKYGDYQYPSWATGIGWTLSCASILPIPVIFTWTLYNSGGANLKERFQNAVKSTKMCYSATAQKPSDESEIPIYRKDLI